MADIITIAGSPLEHSRSSAILSYARLALERQGLSTGAISVRDLPAEDLIHGRFDGAMARELGGLIHEARSIIIATPIYKASYSGVLKAFLDLLPQQAFAGKIVLPIATGGSPAHMLAIDYALRPVLAALGGQHILQGVYITDSQFQSSDHALRLVPEAAGRLEAALQTLAHELDRVVYG